LRVFSFLLFDIFFYLLKKKKRYSSFTQTSLQCKLENNVVGPLNASILVDSQYGRSLTASNLFYVTPNEDIYNFEAYARNKKIKSNFSFGSTFF
jgi:hypothetical protein